MTYGLWKWYYIFLVRRLSVDPHQSSIPKLVPKTFFWLRLRPLGERNNKDAVYPQIKLKSPALSLFCWDLEGGFYVKEKTQTVKFIRKMKRNTQQKTSVLYRNVTYTVTIHSLRSVFVKLNWLNITIPKFHFERKNLRQRLILHSYFWVFTAFEVTKNVPVSF